jgi:uncharacterized paraquat-inducible protein A
MSAEPGEVNYIKASCPHCEGTIEFPEQGVGETIYCPHCSTKIELALPESSHATGREPSIGIFLWAGFIALTFFHDAIKFAPLGICYLASLGTCIVWFIFSLTCERRQSWSRMLGYIAFGCGSILPFSAAYSVALGLANHASLAKIIITFIILIAISLGFIVGSILLVFRKRKYE